MGMTEESKIPKSVYEREAKYMEAMIRHSQDFDKLLATVPEDQAGVREIMKLLYYVEPDKLLDPEKMVKLKEKNPVLFGQVSSYYGNYLIRCVGFDII